MRSVMTTLVTFSLIAIAGAVAAQEAVAAADREYEAQVSTGRVQLEVRPEWRDGRLLFHLKAHTHSVDLGKVDLMNSVQLTVDGVSYEPVDAGSLAGHHGQATVAFALPGPPRAFRLWILDVPDVPVRELRWPGSP